MRLERALITWNHLTGFSRSLARRALCSGLIGHNQGTTTSRVRENPAFGGAYLPANGVAPLSRCPASPRVTRLVGRTDMTHQIDSRLSGRALAACAFSAVLLSGCSWMGFGGSNGQQGYSGQQNARYGSNGAQYNGQTGRRAAPTLLGRCQITAPTQRVPQGCRAEDVTLALGGQRGQAAQNQYTSGGYGSHSQGAQAYEAPQQRLRKPKLRGQFGLEIDHSVSGNLYSPGTPDAVAAYNRANFAEGTSSGGVASGQTVNTIYTSGNNDPAFVGTPQEGSLPGRVISPDISFDDVYTAPLRISGGFEYILGKHNTIYANAGYTRAEGKKGGSAEINEELLRTVTTQDFDALGAPLGPAVTQTTFLPNETVATFDYEFNDLEKYDFEIGGRHYFNPLMQGKLKNTLTPFVSASGGAAHYSETTVRENQRQRFIQRRFDNNQTNPEGDFYDVSFGTPTQIYDAQWVPYGALRAGVEWQMSPKTALAFEAGVKYEGARDFSDGTNGDDIISVPLTIRGSYNF